MLIPAAWFDDGAQSWHTSTTVAPIARRILKTVIHGSTYLNKVQNFHFGKICLHIDIMFMFVNN